MSNHALLNNIDHQALKIDTRHGKQLPEAYGDAVMSCMVYPAEFRNVQAHYPIFFQAREDGQMASVCLFGFEHGENLFLTDDGWEASYKPLMIQRQPFLIGPQQGESEQLAIYVDMDSPRVNDTQGEAVFLPHGGNSDFINHIASVLQAIHQGEHHNKAFCAALEEKGLLESFFLDISDATGATHRLSGFLTINEEKLAELDDETVLAFHKQGYWQAIHMIMASHSALNDLIKRKQQR
ncbi:SapC family protein [Aestuariibacter halophilus]|uniref:SapC family protein n=1 Tax=Fluctibacter halophilus TaxID=226011 RepID=A0ABS8G7T9_9ALTE|nr:SapC family protein [Aestuariibacter halophilus]MCC2616595.1 SapC family protein [Aestuariibacter halophilus]